MLFSSRAKTTPITAEEALPGRADYPFPIPATHEVLGNPIQPPFPDHLETAIFALRMLLGGRAAVLEEGGRVDDRGGISGGFTPYPTYRETCSARTGHAEAVLVVYDPEKITYAELLKTFFEEHNPTQGIRQGNDVGSQYRSAIYYTTEEQKQMAEATIEAYNKALEQAHRGSVTTEIAPAGPVLLRRGLPPAVPVQGPQRILWPEGHGRHLCGTPIVTIGTDSRTIKVYSTTWCGDCVRSKRTLDQHGVAYEEINIENDPTAVALVRRVNGGRRSVPTILFPDNSTLTEPNHRELVHKLKELGLVG